MKKIQRLKDVLALKQELQEDLMQYLEVEFFNLYEYLSNGEKVEDFILSFYQNMVILEGDIEFNKLLSNTLEVEFIEEVNLQSITIYRMGLDTIEDIQLCYAIKNQI